ncbi:MAG: putative metal-binding motif-containing protein, partial [Myxococcales bacterium]|nr:putative metal-binding motif-containing protein [Myxococcales bacterium]
GRRFDPEYDFGSSATLGGHSIAFAPDGVVGWAVVLTDLDGGRLDVYQPAVMMTSDGGETWSDPAEVELSTLLERRTGESAHERLNFNFPYYETRLWKDEDDDGFCIGGIDNDNNGDCLGEGEASAEPTDCDDLDPLVNVSESELCSDGIDNDCDGFVDGVDSDCGGSELPAQSECRAGLFVGDEWVPPADGFGNCGGVEQQAYANVSAWVELDLTVDADGNPHIFTTIGGSDNIVGINAEYGTLLVDITTLDGGTTWDFIEISPEPTMRLGLTGDSGDAFMYQFPQVSRTEDGEYVFYSWATSEPSVVGFGESENSAPDLHIAGWRRSDGALTPVVNVTADNQDWSGVALYPTMAPTVLRADDSFELPIVMTQLLEDDPGAAVKFYYWGQQAVFSDSSFIVDVAPGDGGDLSDMGVADMGVGDLGLPDLSGADVSGSDTAQSDLGGSDAEGGDSTTEDAVADSSSDDVNGSEDTAGSQDAVSPDAEEDVSAPGGSGSDSTSDDGCSCSSSDGMAGIGGSGWLLCLMLGWIVPFRRRA